MGLFQDLTNRGLWRSYNAYVVSLEPVLEATTLRGLPISSERHTEVCAILDAEMSSQFAKMQTLVPPSLGVRKTKLFEKEPKRGTKVDVETTLIAWPFGWTRVWPFKPSNQALKRYMQAVKHPVPKHWKTGKDTTNEDELRRLLKQTKDPLYQAVLDYRDASTVRTNHLHNWTPGPDGCVHPIFYHTSTGQLEARKPNTMNAPHHKPSQGDLFRSIVQSKPGYQLLVLDYKSFHALYLAWEAGDHVMERMARIDLVSFATAHFLKLPHADEAVSWPDDQLRDWLRWVKKTYQHIRDAKMKHAFHGYDNGMRAHGCYMRYRDYFDSRREVERLLSMLDSLFSVAHAFRAQCVEQAHEQGYLMSRFGCVRYFWEVKKKQGSEWSHGDDAEAAASFIQQNCAHCHLKDVMLRLDASGWLAKTGLSTPIHDDLTFGWCRDSDIDEAAVAIRAEMEAPSPITGLAVKVEAKRGLKWNELSEIA